MSVRDRLRSALGLDGETFDIFLYEHDVPMPVVEQNERIYLRPPYSRSYYRARLDDQVRAVIAVHHPTARVVWSKFDRYTEQGGREVWRLRARLWVPSERRVPETH